MPRLPYARDAERVFASSLGLGAVVEGGNLRALQALLWGGQRPNTWRLHLGACPSASFAHLTSLTTRCPPTHSLAPHFPPPPGALLWGFTQGAQVEMSTLGSQADGPDDPARCKDPAELESMPRTHAGFRADPGF